MSESLIDLADGDSEDSRKTIDPKYILRFFFLLNKWITRGTIKVNKPQNAMEFKKLMLKTKNYNALKNNESTPLDFPAYCAHDTIFHFEHTHF